MRISLRPAVRASIALMVAFMLSGCSTAVTAARGALGSGSSGAELAEAATVRIEVEGVFADPEFGSEPIVGGGSGFFIDPSGIVVTNNHVVTGAAILRVHVRGEDSPRRATVLGVSECLDLAVIKVEGSDFPALSWAPGLPAPGTEIYAAGYPGDSDEFALTRGIVSRGGIALSTEWASVDDNVEHDANLGPGSSGGPLVTLDGQVVGVNYAGDDSGQNLAIASGLASSVVDVLAQGDDLDTIGVNGLAFDNGDGDFGIWVSSVATGSAAYEAGVRAGDAITALEGLPVGEAGSMDAYCEILRSHDADDALRIEVYRYDEESYYEGVLNGSPLEVSFTFASEDGARYDEFVDVFDDSGRVYVRFPAAWSDVDGTSFTGSDGNEYFDVSAAGNLDDFFDTWDEPGASVTASYDLARSTNEREWLEVEREAWESECNLETQDSYEDPLYSGPYSLFEECGPNGDTSLMVLVVVPRNRAFLIRIRVQIRSDADWDALDKILDSFTFDYA